MKTNPFTNDVTKAIRAIAMTVVLSAGFSACSDKDVTATESGGVPAQLIGTWYGDYSSQGEITKSAPGTREGIFVRAVQGLTFNADGTGTCYKYLCNVAGDPISIYGGSMDPQNGQFHFTVKDDSIVTIVRDGDGDSQHPKTWTVVNGLNGLRGTDGTTEYSLQTATAEHQAWLSDWEQMLRRGANNDESPKDFLRNWENAETVCLSTYGTRNLPWYGAANNDIPENIRFDMKKRAGWEMAFCMLNDPNSPNVHMFGLYNRFTGILRVYQYVENASGYGKELYVNLVNDSYSPYRYPFYNSMVYSIPVNREWGKTLKKDAELITYGNSYKPFEYLVSAYTRSGEAKGVAPNWHCVDIDLSAYMPNSVDKPWRSSVNEQSSLFNIGLASQNVSEISLAGRMLGGLEGDFNSTTTVKTSCSNPSLARITNVVGNVSGALNSTLTNLNCLCGITRNGANVFWKSNNNNNNGNDGNNNPNANQGGEQVQQPAARAMTRSITFATIVGIGAGLLNISTAILKSIPNSQSTVEDSKGNVNLSLNANIDLKGLITQWAGLPDAGVTVTPFLLNASNENSSIGTGCFGLVDDPVIYIAKEDLLSSSDHINITEQGGKQLCTSIAKDSLRLIAFLDPASIKFYLNTDIYSHIEDLTVTLNYGVDLNQQVGHTDSYRNFMSLEKRPTFKLNKKMNDETSTPRLHVMNPWQVVKNDQYAMTMPDSIKMVKERGSEDYRFFGLSATQWGKNCMMDPQVFVPYNGSTVENPVVPDFFVSVDVNFKCKESESVEFCKPFLPRYVLLTREQLLQKYEELKAYAAKCEAGQPVGELENDPSIKVYNYSSHVFLQKTLDILAKIKQDAEED